MCCKGRHVEQCMNYYDAILLMMNRNIKICNLLCTSSLLTLWQPVFAILRALTELYNKINHYSCICSEMHWDQVLDQCFRIKLNVVSTVCDLSRVNMKALKIFGSTADPPYFKYQEIEIFTVLLTSFFKMLVEPFYEM